MTLAVCLGSFCNLLDLLCLLEFLFLCFNLSPIYSTWISKYLHCMTKVWTSVCMCGFYLFLMYSVLLFIIVFSFSSINIGSFQMYDSLFEEKLNVDPDEVIASKDTEVQIIRQEIEACTGNVD